MASTTYRRPSWFLRAIGNPLMGFLVGRLGLPVRGGAMLDVVGRKSGAVHTVPVNPLVIDGRRYLVAPRGETEWVRNLRGSKQGTLRRGAEHRPFTAVELGNRSKPPILRAYLDRWYPETGAMFGVPKEASVNDLAAIAGKHPVFEITYTGNAGRTER